jgi:hypothetical protein
LKAITAADRLDLDTETRIPVPLCEGLGEVGHPANPVGDRYLRGFDGFAEVKAKRRVSAQLLAHAHEGHVFAEREPVVTIRQLRRTYPGSFSQRLPASSLRHSQIHQGAHSTGRDRPFTHRSNLPALQPAVMWLLREVMSVGFARPYNGLAMVTPRQTARRAGAAAS